MALAALGRLMAGNDGEPPHPADEIPEWPSTDSNSRQSATHYGNDIYISSGARCRITTKKSRDMRGNQPTRGCAQAGTATHHAWMPSASSMQPSATAVGRSTGMKSVIYVLQPLRRYESRERPPRFSEPETPYDLVTVSLTAVPSSYVPGSPVAIVDGPNNKRRRPRC